MSGIRYESRHLQSITAGEVDAKWNVGYSRILRYTIDFWQTDLGIHKQVSAPEMYILQAKVNELMTRWDRMADDHFRKTRLSNSKEACDTLSMEASSKLNGLANILACFTNSGTGIPVIRGQRFQ